jgi:16S rRNA (uracil1498-N3)-methyltransferase
MQVAPPCDITDWLARQPPPPRPHEAARWMLDFADDARAPGACERPAAITALSGPEGGLSASEQAVARAAGFRPVTLGPRVLRAETAPLALLAWAGLGL